MSISAKFFEKLKERRNGFEIFYYRERCLFNAYGNSRESFLDQANRLNDLLEQLERERRKPRKS